METACLPVAPRSGVELKMSCGKDKGKGLQMQDTLPGHACLGIHDPSLSFLMLGNPPFILDLFLPAPLLSLSTGQMDDVLDYICTFHHSRDIHRHLPLLVSTLGLGTFQGKMLPSISGEVGKV